LRVKPSSATASAAPPELGRWVAGKMPAPATVVALLQLMQEYKPTPAQARSIEAVVRPRRLKQFSANEICSLRISFLISPCLSNKRHPVLAALHDVLDEWFENEARPLRRVS
jgi:hypothetical protein